MPEDAATLNQPLVERFVALVVSAVERPQEALEQREAARAVIDALKAGPVTFTLVDGALLADGTPVDAPIVAKRFATYGLEELGITAKASQADLQDLARLLAAAPGDGDPVARFAQRATVLDTKALPRRLRQRQDAPPPSDAAPAVQPAKPTPTPATPRIPAPTPTGSRVTINRTPTPPMPVPVVEARDAPVRLQQVLELPVPTHPLLAAAIDAFEVATDAKQLNAALEGLVAFCDLSFRHGRHDDLIEGITALIAIEHRQLERDSADERRQAFNHSIRRLARPVVLRQLAVLRHVRAKDEVARDRLQQSFVRFGTDAAEALIDECQVAATAEARATVIESLRGLPRTHEALKTLAGDSSELAVRQAIAILGALRDDASEVALLASIGHDDPRTRREVVAALSRFTSESAMSAVEGALDDDAAQVRLRAVSALSARRDPRTLAPLDALLRREAEREVVYAAVDAIGKVANAEAVQLLVPIAQGQGAGPLKDTAGLRIQACIALVAIRTPQAMAAVQGLQTDRDREVRQAAVRLVAQARRRTTTSQAVIVAE